MSIGKILILAACGIFVWFMFRRWWRSKWGPPAQSQAPAPPPRARSTQPATEAMIRCARCGVYMAENAGRCERADCPRPA
jgi:hypothetical protein